MALYRSATVFPNEGEKSEPSDKRIGVKADKVFFEIDDCRRVEAYINQSFDFEQLKDAGVWKDVIYPAVKAVRDDLESVKGFVNEFFGYADDKKILPMLHYDLDGSEYRVYDYPKILLGTKPFEKAINVHDFVGIGVNRIPYVKGKTLSEALERALTIYKSHRW